MKLLNDLYTLKELKKESSKINGEIELNAKHHIFDGHFPGNPVLPGVCMIEIVKELLQVATEKKYRLLEGSNVKFMNILNPETNPVVRLEHEIVGETEDTVKLKSCITDGEKIFLKFSGTFINYSF